MGCPNSFSLTVIETSSSVRARILHLLGMLFGDTAKIPLNIDEFQSR